MINPSKRSKFETQEREPYITSFPHFVHALCHERTQLACLDALGRNRVKDLELVGVHLLRIHTLPQNPNHNETLPHSAFRRLKINSTTGCRLSEGFKNEM